MEGLRFADGAPRSRRAVSFGPIDAKLQRARATYPDPTTLSAPFQIAATRARLLDLEAP
jgi:hypothetical protein